MKVADIKEKARGNWPWILAGLGIDARCLINRHGPCPGCGGENRFRFDDKGGNGTWFCGQGGGDWTHGDGFDLLVHVFGWEIKQTINEVADFLQLGKTKLARPMPKPFVPPRISSTSDYAFQIWNGASERGAAQHPYAVDKDIERAGPLRRKHVTGKLIGSQADCIVVPARNIITDSLQGVQVVNAAGKKQSFGTIKGACCILGNSLDKKLPWFVVEGYADAWSMVYHVFDGHACAVMAFSSGQMKSCAKAIAEKYNPKMIIIVEDAK